jgi:hypothetical protein
MSNSFGAIAFFSASEKISPRAVLYQQSLFFMMVAIHTVKHTGNPRSGPEARDIAADSQHIGKADSGVCHFYPAFIRLLSGSRIVRAFSRISIFPHSLTTNAFIFAPAA